MNLPGGPLTQHFFKTMIYLLVIWNSDPGKLRPVLEPLHLWSGVWIGVFGFGVVILTDLVADWLLLRGRNGLWKRFYGNVDDKTLEQRRRMLTYAEGETSVTTGFAGGAMLGMMAAIAAGFVWFAFLA